MEVRDPDDEKELTNDVDDDDSKDSGEGIDNVYKRKKKIIEGRGGGWEACWIKITLLGINKW